VKTHGDVFQYLDAGGTRVSEIEREWTALLGKRKMQQLRELLQELNDKL
jgi:hypothetical protein